MEVTYTDEENGGAFEESCIPELTELAQTYEDFSGSETILNGGYSMRSDNLDCRGHVCAVSRPSVVYSTGK